jgi:hypothetical protein
MIGTRPTPCWSFFSKEEDRKTPQISEANLSGFWFIGFQGSKLGTVDQRSI